MKLNFRLNNKKQLQVDRAKLRKLGYIQELDRSVGIFSNFSISFSVISILTGLITLYDLNNLGNGYYEFWSWIIVGVFQLFMAFSLGEIASCYPIESGVYEWTNILSNNILGWFNGWISLIGWIACTTGINFGLSEFILQIFGVESSVASILLICILIISIQTLINFAGIKLITIFNNYSVILHITGVLIISFLLLIFSKHPVDWQEVSISKAFDNFNILYYIPSLLTTAWTLTAFDASASISEECINPTKTVPVGMIMSVAVSIICGSLLLFSLNQNSSVLSDIQIKSGIVSIDIIITTLGHTVGKFISIILVLAMFSCGLASHTVTARIIYAFSRKNGLPFSAIWKSIPENYDVPIFSILICSAIEILLSFIILIISSKQGNALPLITSLSTAGIYMSYAIVMISAISKRRQINKDKGNFHLGKFGLIFNIVSLIWAVTITGIMIVFYAKMFYIIILILIIYYFVYMKKILMHKEKRLSENELIKIENDRGID
ncbi:MAG: amino acid transporter [Bacillota bacterium]|nr:amino acid transporter [Bacillota bacterium]